VAATFVTPQGVHLWRYVATEMTHGTNRQYIAEWAPISFSHGDVWSSLALAAAAALVAGGAWIASSVARELRPAPWVWALSCVPIVAMSCLSVRHVPIAVIWCAPIVASLWAAGRPSLAWPWRAAWTAFSAIALTTVYLAFVVVWMEPRPTVIEEGRVLGSTHPCRVVQFARDHRLAGNVYAPLWWGSYITWVLYPDVRVAMDGRNISLYPEAMVVENLEFYAASPDALDAEVPLRYPTDFLLAPADMPALARLERDPRWDVVYRDSDAVLFVRAGSAHPPHAAVSRVPEAAPAFERCGPTL
jgi:hypothetical protein